jgi:hypothetical protein
VYDEDENIRSRPVISEDDAEEMEEDDDPSKDPTVENKSVKSVADSVNAEEIL